MARLIPTTLDGFRGDFYFLSNMYPHDIHYDGQSFHSSEQMYQWLKSQKVEPYASWVLEALTPKASKKVAQLQGFPDVEDNAKIRMMELAIDIKFSDPRLGQMLVDTDGVELVEYNWWRDTFWGVDINTNKGSNYLGKLLMYKRQQLMAK